jgi:hypothetical protein
MNHVQKLESRQLLSAAIFAAKTKPTIPNIVEIFEGTSTQKKPNAQPSESLEITFTNETAKGVLTGTLASGSLSPFAATGTVNAKGKLSIKFLAEHNAKGTITGTYSAGSHVISGTYSLGATKENKAQSGTFSVTALVA